jgi:hypothetical protein
MFTIDCRKDEHNKLWCFDYMFTEELSVKNEPLMHQASALINWILIDKFDDTPEVITVAFSPEEFEGSDVTLEYSHSDYGGSIYNSTRVLDWTEGHEKEIWLCPVLTYFFESPPKNLYVLINVK